MLTQQTSAPLADAETEFRRRLREKLAARGVAAAEIDARIDMLLRQGVKLKLDSAAILGDA